MQYTMTSASIILHGDTRNKRMMPSIHVGKGKSGAQGECASHAESAMLI